LENSALFRRNSCCPQLVAVMSPNAAAAHTVHRVRLLWFAMLVSPFGPKGRNWTRLLVPNPLSGIK
jgi:hypothetical protein